MKVINTISLLLLLSFPSFGKERLDRKLPIYAIIKPNKISTQVALGSGIVHRINYQVGERVDRGTTLIEVIEKEGIRQYTNTIRGHVAKLHVTLGAATTAGMPLITVLDPKDKVFEVSLSPEEAKLLKKGDRAYRPGSSKVIAVVDRISPLVDPDRGAVTSYLMPLTETNDRIGEIIGLEVIISSSKECDLVSKIADLGRYTRGWKVEYLSGDKACLNKIE